MWLRNWLQARIRLLTKEVKTVHKALRAPQHDNTAVRTAWRAANEKKRKEATIRLARMLARSTTSINNSYQKAQIFVALLIGLLAAFAVIGQVREFRWPIITAIIMDVLGVLLLAMIISGRGSVWREDVSGKPGVVALEQTEEDAFVALSKRVLLNRLVLLGNRRITWMATWFFTLPSLFMAIWFWSETAAILASCVMIATAWIYRILLGAGRPVPPPQYPLL